MRKQNDQFIRLGSELLSYLLDQNRNKNEKDKSWFSSFHRSKTFDRNPKWEEERWPYAGFDKHWVDARVLGIVVTWSGEKFTIK